MPDEAGTLKIESGNHRRNEMKTSSYKTLISALAITVALMALSLVASSRVIAQGETRQFKIGDHVEVDANMTSWTWPDIRTNPTSGELSIIPRATTTAPAACRSRTGTRKFTGGGILAPCQI